MTGGGVECVRVGERAGCRLLSVGRRLQEGCWEKRLVHCLVSEAEGRRCRCREGNVLWPRVPPPEEGVPCGDRGGCLRGWSTAREGNDGECCALRGTRAHWSRAF